MKANIHDQIPFTNVKIISLLLGKVGIWSWLKHSFSVDINISVTEQILSIIEDLWWTRKILRILTVMCLPLTTNITSGFRKKYYINTIEFSFTWRISNLVDTKKLLIYSYNSKDMTYMRYRTKAVIKVFTISRVCSVYCICLWEKMCIAKLNIQIQDIIPTWFIKTELWNFLW